MRGKTTLIFIFLLLYLTDIFSRCDFCFVRNVEPKKTLQAHVVRVLS